MTTRRAENHPVIKEKKHGRKVKFSFNNEELTGIEGEALSSALFANEIKSFGHHHKDKAPQGIFCANGQCGQCNVIVDGIKVKACMTALEENMTVYPADRTEKLAFPQKTYENFEEIPVIKCTVLIIGAGPSGISAAIELGKLGIDTILADDKNSAGGKLLLQTHQFFGTKDECFAGTRGINIATLLENEMNKYSSVQLWTDSPVIAVFEDKKFGVIKQGVYTLVEPVKVIAATGARERSIPFPGWDLPGVYGAGAFQTLLNRDLVKPCENLFIMGGGNVGLIAAYHAMQAGIKVCGLAEIMPKTGGYEVHLLKIKRLGVPVYLNHTVAKCSGDENGLQSVTICEIDENFKPKPDKCKTIQADTLLLALGLSPVNELICQARDIGIDIRACGDAQEIAEASAAMFSGKIAGFEIAQELGYDVEFQNDLKEKCEIMKSRPGKRHDVAYPETESEVHPVIHCFEEIPCDPCTKVCPHGSMNFKDKNSLTSVPGFSGKCTGCAKCVLICPGLAITLLDKRNMPKDTAKITLPYELEENLISENSEITLTDREGNILGKGVIDKINKHKAFDSRALVTVVTDMKTAERAAGFRMTELAGSEPLNTQEELTISDSQIICKCERITAGEIRKALAQGARTLGELKTLLRVTMGSCGGKTCSVLINKILSEEGLDCSVLSLRPLEMETQIGVFAGRQK